MTKQQLKQRNNNIALSAQYDHLTLAAIGKKYDLTRERVRQILKQLGINYNDILQRRQHREKVYQESLKAARAYYATTLPDGGRRPEYGVYANMLRRCKNKAYARYGGRGISVCDKWLGEYGFHSFLLDVGPRPEGKYASGRAIYSLHRINNDGNYEPGNCKWATQKEQCANRRKPKRNEKVGEPIMLRVYDTGANDQQPDLRV